MLAGISRYILSLGRSHVLMDEALLRSRFADLSPHLHARCSSYRVARMHNLVRNDCSS